MDALQVGLAAGLLLEADVTPALLQQCFHTKARSTCPFFARPR